MTEAEPLLELRKLVVRFPGPARGTINAVDQVNLSLSPGTSLGLVGPSGSGKTAIGLAIMGLLSEAARIEGEIIWRRRHLARTRDWIGVRGRGMTMMFQDARASLNPALTIGFQLKAVLRDHPPSPGEDIEGASLRLLQQVRLQDPSRLLTAYAHELSGGMAQRAALALALACRPELLIVDEPTAALDPTVAVAIVALLRDLRRTMGLTLLVISHDLNVVRALCDQTSVVSGGAIVEAGPTASLLEHPRHPETVALVDAARWRLPD